MFMLLLMGYIVMYPLVMLLHITLCFVAPFACSPFIEEKCLIAPIVAAKTTRMIHAENMRKFVKLGKDVQFVHAVSIVLCIALGKRIPYRIIIRTDQIIFGDLALNGKIRGIKYWHFLIEKIIHQSYHCKVYYS